MALALAIVALLQIRRANLRLLEVTPDISGLAQRVQGKSGEEALAAIFSQLETLSQTLSNVKVEIGELDRMVSRSIRRIGLVRFDANEEIRAGLSFALCMLDNRDNGLLLCSVYTLEECRVFLRGILNGKAQHDLMPEEAEALQQALAER